MIQYKTPLVVLRDSPSGQLRLPIKGFVSDEAIYFPVDADVEEGDAVERLLPNGKAKIYRLTEVEVHQDPFGGSSELEHTTAKFEVASSRATESRQAHTFNVHATNVQLATGDRSKQTMTVGQSADQLVLVIRGISEVLSTLGLANGREAELERAEQEAIKDVSSDQPNAAGVRRFYDWVVECAKKGGSAAVVAAVTAAAGGLLHDAETLVSALEG